ncbi:hypothetical protein HDU93_002000 [Gonapodya sp. JEL0774]|nr:hypothetical protein HDU93_002000 [Gonapodya sp. JEL0774]
METYAEQAETEEQKQVLLQELFHLGKDAVAELEAPMKNLHAKYTQLQIQVLDQEKMLVLTDGFGLPQAFSGDVKQLQKCSGASVTEMLTLIVNNVEQLRQEFFMLTGTTAPEYTDEQLEEGWSQIQNHRGNLYEFDPELNLLVRHPVPTNIEGLDDGFVTNNDEEADETEDATSLAESGSVGDMDDRGETEDERTAGTYAGRRFGLRKRALLERNRGEAMQGDSDEDDESLESQGNSESDEEHFRPRWRDRKPRLKPADSSAGAQQFGSRRRKRPPKVVADGDVRVRSSEDGGEGRDRRMPWAGRKRQRPDVDDLADIPIEGGRKEIDQKRAEERAQKEELLRKRNEELSKSESLVAREEQFKRKEEELRRKERELEERKRGEGSRKGDDALQRRVCP